MTQSQILALLTPVIGFALEGRNQNLASTLQVIQIINDGDKKVSVVLPFCFFFLAEGALHKALHLMPGDLNSDSRQASYAEQDLTGWERKSGRILMKLDNTRKGGWTAARADDYHVGCGQGLVMDRGIHLVSVLASDNDGA